jgi:hypothetical protein
MMDWKPICRGAVGLELHGWHGIGAGRDLFHHYAVLGVITVYATTTPLYRFLKMMREARDVMRARAGK